MFDVITYYLSNGMRVMLHRESGTRIVKCGVVVNQGAMHESTEDNGISHFLEHMIYAQTEDDEHIKNYKDEFFHYGATSYATTYKSSTMYYVSGLATGTKTYLEFLRDLVFRAKILGGETINRERDVVTRELVSFYSSFNQINDRSIQALYGEHNIGRIIIGKKDNVARFTTEDFQKIYDNSYVPGNSALVVFGDIDYYEMEDMINALFEPLIDIKTRMNEEQVMQSPSIYMNNSYKGENGIVCLCHRYMTNSDSRLNENCIAVLLDAMCNPTLCQRAAYDLRMKTGLAYQIGGFVKNMNSLYAGGVNAVAKNSDIKETAKIIWDHFCTIREYGFAEKELDIIKKNIIYQKLEAKNDMSTQADVLLHMAMNPFVYSPENDIRMVENLSLEEVNNKIKDLLQVENFGVAGIGSYDIGDVVNIMTR